MEIETSKADAPFYWCTFGGTAGQRGHRKDPRGIESDLAALEN